VNPASTNAPQLPLIVILPGNDKTVLGLSIHERNARVARRAGATCVGATTLPHHGNRLAMLVRPGAIIDLPLFSAIAEIPPGARPSRLVATDSSAPAVLVGRARELAPFVDGAADETALAAWTVAEGLLDGTTRSARRSAGWRILRRTAKSTDGWVSRHFNRPVSRAISYALLSLRLRPNHVSIMTLMLGLVAAAIGATPGSLALIGTGFLLHLTSVLDGVDGEIARATLTESEAGARLDTLVDRSTCLLCFGGVMIGWGREVGLVQASIVGLVVVLGLFLSLARGERFIARHGSTSFLLIDRSVRRAAHDSQEFLLRLAAGGFSLLRRDLFSVLFLALSFTGRRELIPAIVVFGMVLANLTLSRYHRELATAAASLTGRPVVFGAAQPKPGTVAAPAGPVRSPAVPAVALAEAVRPDLL
jgi:phosphatidylglycerophosphate synthase